MNVARRKITPNYSNTNLTEWNITKGNNTLIIVLNHKTGHLSGELVGEHYQSFGRLSQDQLRKELQHYSIMG